MTMMKLSTLKVSTLLALAGFALAACSSSGSSGGSSGGGTTPTPPPPGGNFSFLPVGTLIAGSGTGYSDNTVYRNIRFPLLKVPAYANSQVYRPGGSQNATPGQCNSTNYAYPWQDNFCETRTSSTNIWCPSGKGHQGQDIRGESCKSSSALDAEGKVDANVVVAAESGTVIVVQPHYIKVQTDDETTFYNYLHMDQIQVGLGDYVAKGQRLGRVANIGPAGTPYTTRHLHFELKQVMNIGGSLREVHVNPYATLLDSYQRLLAGNP